MMHLRDRLKIKAIRSGDDIDWDNFKRARNNVNNNVNNNKNYAIELHPNRCYFY